MFPINDPAVYPTVAGGSDGGQEVDLHAGPRLRRREFDVLINSQVTELEFEWITQPVTLRVVDQHGVLIPGARVSTSTFIGVNALAENDTQLVFPVNDLSVYPTASGPSAGGLEADVMPVSSLRRRETGLVVNPSTTVIEFEWHVISGPLRVVDAEEVEILNATWTWLFDGVSRPSGNAAEFPITDNAIYPSIAGLNADGYSIEIGLPGGLSEAFQFEVLPDGSIQPMYVDIAGVSCGIRFQTNLPPIVDSGDNLLVSSACLASTTVVGSASDPDGDPLTAIWTLNDQPVLGPVAVPVGGQVAIDLHVLGLLTAGEYELALEIDDGSVAVSDEITLTVGNSSPVVAMPGSISMALGTPLEASATIADFDGDLISYSWLLDGFPIESGFVQAIPGGTPIEVPPFVPVTGLGLGEHLLALQVADGFTPTQEHEIAVYVQDIVAPTLAPIAEPSILWPPNHQMVPVVITLNAMDDSGGPLQVDVEVVSSENADKTGDGHTIPDFSIPSLGALQETVLLDLRAERSGKGSGRTYTVIITVTDTSGNETISTIEVICPKRPA